MSAPDPHAEYENWLLAEARTWARLHPAEAKELAERVTNSLRPLDPRYAAVENWPGFAKLVRSHAIAEAVRKETQGPVFREWLQSRS